MAILGLSSSNTTKTPPATALRIQTSVLGIPRPIGWGQARLSGNLMWYGDFVAKSVSSSGGKGLGGASSGKGTSGGTYNYSAAVLIALCEGPIEGVLSVWNNTTEQTLSDLGLTAFLGDYAQSAWGYLTSLHPTQALNYRGTASVAAGPLQLGTSQELPNFSFEILFGINSAIPGMPDANPADVLYDLLTNPFYGVGFPAENIGDLSLWSNYCLALGLVVSPTITSQAAASSFVDDLMTATNSELVWSGDMLTVVPYGDEVIVGNGYTYVPPTTNLFDFGDDDMIPNSSAPSGVGPFWVTRNATNEAKNIISVEYLDRTMNYNPNVVTATDDASVTDNGPLNADQSSLHMFCLQAAAQMSAQLLLGRQQVRNTAQVIVGPEYFMLDPMDLTEYVDVVLGADNQGIRITEITENDDDSFTIVVEEYGPGMGSAPVYGSQPNDGHIPNYQIDPGPANAPAVFDVPVSLADTIGLETWVATAGGPNWGGCNVYLSSDNATFGFFDKVVGPARIGAQSADFPVTADPDTVTPLSVDLTESFGELLGGTMNDADKGNTLCFVDGEYVAYQQATLTSQYHYDLGATGSTPGYLRRGLYGSAIADHPMGSLFVRLDDSVLRIPYKTTDVGSTIYIKLQSFNQYGGGIEDLSTVTSYAHTIGGPAVLYAATNLRVTPGIKSLQLNWTNPGDIGLVAMEIWRSPNSSFGSATHIDDTPAYATNYTDLTTGSVTAYWYWIRVRDLSGNEGLFEPSNLGAGITATTASAGSSDLGANSVTNTAIASSAVDNRTLGSGAVGTGNVANGAITGPLIANSAVDTVNVNSAAITDTTEVSGSSTTIAQSPSFTSVCSVSITNYGGTEVVQFTDNFTRSGGHSPNVTYQVYRDGNPLTPLGNFGGSGVPTNMGAAIVVSDVPGAGAHTYEVLAQVNGGDPACTSNAPTMIISEYKK